MKKSSMICLFLLVFPGCSFFRHQIIPLEQHGPHGGPMVQINEGVPRYLEFVAIPQSGVWLIQLYAFDPHLEPKDFSYYATVDIVTDSGNKSTLNLWNTKHLFIPGRTAGHLEGSVRLDDVARFKATVTLVKGRDTCHLEKLEFEYPYSV